MQAVDLQSIGSPSKAVNTVDMSNALKLQFALSIAADARLATRVSGHG
jgi:hypothetical protein